MLTHTALNEEMKQLAKEGEALLGEEHKTKHPRDFLWLVIQRDYADGLDIELIAGSHGLKVGLVKSLAQEFGEPRPKKRNRKKPKSTRRELTFAEALRFNQLRIAETVGRWKRYDRKMKQALVPTQAERHRTDMQFRMSRILRGRIRSALKGKCKSAKTRELVGCSIPQLIKHIESQFKKGMTWKNHGRGEKCWHVDHIMPCVAFDLTKADHQKRCFHWTNLRPAWEKDNLSKNGKITFPQLSLPLEPGEEKGS